MKPTGQSAFAKSGFGIASLAFAALLVAFGIWCVQLVTEVRELRAQVETRVSWLRILESVGGEDYDTRLAYALAEMRRDPQLAPLVDQFEEATDREAARRELKNGVRRETGAFSIALGERWNSMNALAVIALMLAASQLVLLIGVRRVLTSRARIREQLLEERLTEADRLAVVGTLTASIAHEVNNPLASVQGSLEIAAEAIRDDQIEDASPAIAHALEATERTIGIIRDLKGLARRDEADAAEEGIDIAAAINAAVNLATTALRKGTDVQVSVPEDLPPVRGRQARIRQLFLNLVLNAGQAMGRLPADKARISIRAFAEEGAIVVRVDDTGPGMSKSLRERAFEPYVTTKGKEGTGLGLFLCKRIAESAGGEITILDPVAGVGTRIEVRLPIASRTVVPLRTAPPKRDIRRVLIIDDEPGLAATIARLLRPHEVETAENASEALELLEKGHFDVVLCDVNMPNMSGFDLIESVPDLRSKFILMTGAEFSPDDEDLDVRRIRKPFLRAQLLAVIDQTPAGRSASA